MSVEKVQQALIAQLLSAFQSWQDAGNIQWENVTFKPKPNTQYMAVFFMPAASRVATLGAAGLDEDSGLFQVTLVLPGDKGEMDSRKTIDQLRTCFKPGNLSYSGQSVTIISRSRAGGMPVDGFFKIPFTVSWRAQLTR